MISIEEWRGRIGSFKNIKNNSQGNETDFDIQLREKCILSINQTLRLLAEIRRLLVIGGIETNPGPQTTLSYDPACDSKCNDPTICQRKLGSSNIFKNRQSTSNNIENPQNIKTKIRSKFKSVTNFFKKYLSTASTLENQLRSQYSILEKMKNIFTDIDPATGDNKFETEYNLVVEMEKRIQFEYNDLFTGKIDEFVSIPETFHYEKDMTISIKGLEDRIKVEKENGENAYGFNQTEIKRMENDLENIKGEVAENEVHSKLKLFFSKQRGVLFHSFHPESILSPLVSRAKAQRQNRNSLSLTSLEIKIIDILNIDMAKVKQEADAIMTKIQQNLSNNNNYSVTDLENELNKQKQNQKKKFGVIIGMVKQISKATGKSDYSFEESKEAISIGISHHYFRPDGEMDFIGVLPDDKLIFTFEVKYQLTDPSCPPTKLLNSATTQTKNNEEFLSRIFARMLSYGWRLIKVPIILQQDSPGTLDPTTYCSHCQKFIITSSSLNDLPSWFKQSGLKLMAPHKSVLSQNYAEYLSMLEIIITSISINNHLNAWERVVGSNYDKPIAVGHTAIDEKIVDDRISYDTAKSKSHDAQKLLFFSQLQLSLLKVSNYLCIILWGDYGTGKTLILKERVIRSKKKNRDVVLLSLGSCDAFGIPLKTPLVYDILTKRETKKHKIEFHNSVELGQMFRNKTFVPVRGDNKQFVMETIRKRVRGEITHLQRNKTFDDAGIDWVNAAAYYNEKRLEQPNTESQQIDVYDALVNFVKKNRGRDISIDELPILMNPKSFKYDMGALKRLKDTLAECKSLMLPGTSLVVCLQSNHLQDLGGGYPEGWKTMVQNCQKELQEMHHFICPILDINFRNSSSIYKSVNSLQKSEGFDISENVQNTLGIPKMGTTLDSTSVRQINFNWQHNNEKQHDLDKAMSFLFNTLQKDIDPQNDPLIILCDDVKFTIDQVQRSLRSLQNGMNVYSYPSFNDPNPEKEIDSFLLNLNGVLVTTHSLFKGSEAENVVSLQQSQVTSSNVRGTLLRSVSRLYILNGLDESERYKINDTINDNSLLYCFQECNLNLWECLECSKKSKNKILVCMSCAKTCHENHKIEVRSIQQRNLDGKCQCTNHQKE